MPDLRKTIKAMECCLGRNYFSRCPGECPYNGTEQDVACGVKVLNDALELLKEMKDDQFEDPEELEP